MPPPPTSFLVSLLVSFSVGYVFFFGFLPSIRYSILFLTLSRLEASTETVFTDWFCRVVDLRRCMRPCYITLPGICNFFGPPALVALFATYCRLAIAWTPATLLYLRLARRVIMRSFAVTDFTLFYREAKREME